MGNHFHLVLETPHGNLEVVSGTYTSRFNRRRKLFGHLFSGRYKALIVDGSRAGYLHTVRDYMHLNPARAKLLVGEFNISLSSRRPLVLTAGMKRNTNSILTVAACLALTGVTLMSCKPKEETAPAPPAAPSNAGTDKSKGEPGIGPSFKGPIGLQLYSLRDQFAKDVPNTLAKARGFGFKYVELAGTYGNPPEKFKQMLAEHGLVPVAGHFAYEKYRDDVEAIATEAKALGLEYAGCAWIPHQENFDEKECRDAIAVFNRAGEALAKHGLKFFYHVHGYEFEPHGSGTLFDLLMAETKPEFVSYEMDVLWVVFPGQDPAQLFDKYGERWTLAHLKDLKKGVKTGSLSGHTDVANNVVMGAGQIEWPSFFRAAKKAGVKYYFIEDESPSVVEQIPQSLRYLEQVKF